MDLEGEIISSLSEFKKERNKNKQLKEELSKMNVLSLGTFLEKISVSIGQYWIKGISTFRR